jgi:hypothetical protein
MTENDTPKPPDPPDPAVPPDPGGDEIDEFDEFDEEAYEAQNVQPKRRILAGGRLLAVGVAALLVAGGGTAFAMTQGGDDDSDDDGTGDGRGGPPSEEEQEAFEDAAFEFAQCMRDHGIEDYPDPEVDGNGGMTQRGPGPGGSPQQAEEMEEAHEACQPILDEAMPEPPDLSPEEEAEMQDQAVAMAQCMRDRGWEEFPDPQVSDGGIAIQLGPDSGIPGPEAPDFEQFELDQEECMEESGLGGPGGRAGGLDGTEEGGA